MGKKIVNSFKDILSRVGENWIEAMKYYNEMSVVIDKKPGDMF